jgi:hypothetical protein
MVGRPGHKQEISKLTRVRQCYEMATRDDVNAYAEPFFGKNRSSLPTTA